MNRIDPARRFWNWKQDEDTGERVLYLDGNIAENSWAGDEITPALFREELFSGTGDITIWLNSSGGDVIAASRIYASLMDYKGNVTVKIDGIAASAASVIAMAGTNVLMAPTALMFIHNPATVAMGDAEEMRRTIDMLAVVKGSIMNAYQIKTGLSRAKLSRLMDAPSYFDANLAVALGFADGILEDEKKRPNAVTLTREVVDRLLAREPPVKQTKPGIPAEALEKRLFLIIH